MAADTSLLTSGFAARNSAYNPAWRPALGKTNNSGIFP
jgi:hypothetical protein